MEKKIFVVNCGSSSVKFQVIEMPSEQVKAVGLVEKIGSELAHLKLTVGDKKIEEDFSCPTHQEALDRVCRSLIEEKIVESLSEIVGCGHRMAHGGERFKQSVIITEDICKEIETFNDLAPLHNPVNILGYKVLKELIPNAIQVAVFDTAFHQTMKEDIYLYPIPYEYYDKYRIRKYGFHGTSHHYVVDETRKWLGEENTKRVIVCHLGNGASLCAIENGQSIDTSMGFTPLGGLMMGTRSGNIDPAIVQFLCHKENASTDEIINILNNKSGMLGLSGITNDMRELVESATSGNQRAQTALAVYARRVSDYIGSYVMKLGGIDALVFTAGIGENSGYARKLILDDVSSALGIAYDQDLNSKTRGERVRLSTSESKVEVLVVPTNEELMIAKDVFAAL